MERQEPKQKLVSVVTVVFNGEKTIRRTFDSILNQTYSEIEYIVIDGGSKDSTVDIIREYELKFKERNIRFHWVSEKDKGIYDAMNKGIRLATGVMVGIINADDWYEPQALTDVMSVYSDQPFQVIYGSGMFWNSNGVLIRKNVFTDASQLGYGKMIWHPGVFVSLAAYRKFDGFSTSYRIASDKDLMLRLYFSGEVSFTSVPSVVFNFTDGGVSAARWFPRESMSVLLKYWRQIPTTSLLMRLFTIYMFPIKAKVRALLW